MKRGVGCNGRGWRRKTSGANADGQGVWSWRPDAGVKLAGDDLQATVAKQGRPGNSGEPVVTMRVWFFDSHARLRVHWAPGFPCALCSFEGHASHNNPGAIRAAGSGTHVEQ
jgi:hypothetical protein